MRNLKQIHLGILALLILGFVVVFSRGGLVSGQNVATTDTEIIVVPSVPVAQINNLPSEVNVGTALNVTISGADTVEYRFQFDGAPFGPVFPIATPITDVFATEGSHTLFVIGGSGAPFFAFQSEANATSQGFNVVTPGGGGYSPSCGNGILDPQIGEQCDDGNFVNGDGCSVGCQLETLLLSPENCIAIPTVDAMEWNWGMPAGTSEHTGFRLTETVVAVENTLVQTSDPLLYVIGEAGLISNTQYPNRKVYAITASEVSDAALCPDLYTLMPEPDQALDVFAGTVSIAVSVPASFEINNLTVGQSGIWFEIFEDVLGVLTPIENSGWLQSRDLSFFGLNPETDYVLFYKLRNADGVETDFSPQVAVSTTALSGTLDMDYIANTVIPNEAEVNEELTYRVNYVNGTAFPITNVVMSDLLQAELAFVSGSLVGLDQDLSLSFNPLNSEVEATISLIESGEVGWFEYKAVVDTQITLGLLQNQATGNYDLNTETYDTTSNLLNITIISSDVTIDLFSDDNTNGTQEAEETAEDLGEIDELEEIAKIYGAKGLAYFVYNEEGIKSPILKFLKENEIEAITKATGAKKGDIVFFGADKFVTACEALGQVRLKCGEKLELIDQNIFAYCWVNEFPMFERSENGEISAVHHPFTRPMEEDQKLLETVPEKARAIAYDIVLNGCEIGGGSIRIHEHALQQKIFEILKITPEDAEMRFGHMLQAFSYGAPPHGGIAWGLDRLVMLFAGEPNIREVIAFPKDQKAKDLTLGAPAEMPAETVKEANVQIINPS